MRRSHHRATALVAFAILTVACETEEAGPETLGSSAPAISGVERRVDDVEPSTTRAAVTAPTATSPTTTDTANTTTSAGGADVTKTTASPTSTATPTTTDAPTTTAAAPTSTTTTALATTTTSPPTTTAPQTILPPTTLPPTTLPPTTTTSPPPGGGHFTTLAVGSTLPSGAWCASQVQSAPEVRAGNAGPNATRGTSSNDRYPRVDGDFVGTTDEIIQWAACKWGIDEDIARAQAAKESWWHNSAGGDLTWDQNACHVDLQTPSGSQCPESIGLLQVRWLYHMEAFEDSNSILSTAYNADYTYAVWRDCYDGNLTWLNDVERGGWYDAGDVDGCLGVWFSGRWYTAAASGYIAAVNDYLGQRIWEQAWFISG